jgi:hypothetical protein
MRVEAGLGKSRLGVGTNLFLGSLGYLPLPPPPPVAGGEEGGAKWDWEVE